MKAKNNKVKTDVSALKEVEVRIKKVKDNQAERPLLPGADAVVYDEHTLLKSHSSNRTVLETEKTGTIASVKKSGTKQSQPTIWQAGLRDLADRQEPKTYGVRSDSGQSTSSSIKTNAGEVEAYLNSGVFPTAGLALSGGGIRSAAFCTGAVQALAFGKTFGVFDYLSTVSGGGYLGSLVNINQQAGNGFVLLDSRGEKKDTPAVQFLRDNANYLHFGNPVEMLRNLAVYLRGLFANVVILSMILFFLAAVTVASNSTLESLTKPDLFGLQLPATWSKAGIFGISVAIALIVFVFNISWANVLSFAKSATTGIWSKILWLAAFAPLLICIVAFLELQPLLINKMIGPVSKIDTTGTCLSGTLNAQCTDEKGVLLQRGNACPTSRLVYSCEPKEKKVDAFFSSPALQHLTAFAKSLLAPILALATLLSTNLGEFFRQEAVKNTWTSLLKRNTSRILVYLAAASFLILLWLQYLYLVYWGIHLPNPENYANRDIPVALSASARKFMQWTGTSGSYALFYFAVSALLYLLVFKLKPNANSLHGLYRDRLGAAFCFKMNGTASHPAGDTKLSALASSRPIQLFNTAINLQRSEVVRRRGRKADFFMFSPLWIGSEATGYAPTKQVEALPDAVDLDIATAVAVSGAAVSSNMGSQSMRPLSLLLGALNVRLGYWFPNPRMIKSPKSLRPSLWYFLAETFGKMEEGRNTIYLTDGGHLENLGVYELLRRRCRLIVAIDAEADQDLSFRSLVTLQRYARIDLGARIDLKWSKISETSKLAMTDPAQRSQGPHCAIGTIEYDGGGHGVLVYVKLSVTGDENDYIRDYNVRNPAFPHESTGDQFFSEEQFEAYRALGFHAVNGMLSGKQTVETLAGKLEHLDDENAEGEGVKLAAKLLGVTPKAYVSQPEKPNIHLVKMVV